MIKQARTVAFTLVELILVMVVLAVVMAFVAPNLSRSLRGRALEQEATRFLALTELARDEAVSQGAPMCVWIDTQSQTFGMSAADEYSGIDLQKQYALSADVHFEKVEGAIQSNGIAISFRPDGTPSLTSITAVQLADRFDEIVTVQRQTNGWGYEIAKVARQ